MNANGKIHFINHAPIGADLVRGIGQRLRMSKAQCDWITTMVSLHQRPLDLFLCQQGPSRESAKALGRFLRICSGYTPFLLLHALADTQGKKPGSDAHQDAMIGFFKATLADYLGRIQPMTRQAPLLSGNDLIEGFHLRPSPALGDLLNQLLEAQLSGIIHDRQQARQWVKDLLARHNSEPDSV